jgi:putative two-component system response regulator
VLGARVLEDGGSPLLETAAQIARSHHERWDGGGYPFGLRGAAIPVGARIFSVSDSFDAMISNRPYRRGMSFDQARREIHRSRDTQFDPAVVDAFEQVFDRLAASPVLQQAQVPMVGG